VVLFDQRGAGKSTPTIGLRQNTSQHPVSDIDVLRKHLQIVKWYRYLFFGPWGSTLSVLYAQVYPEMSVREIFTVRKSELETSCGSIGAANITEAYEAFVNYLPGKYYDLLASEDYETRVAEARE
jgi:Predicted hydrolases or acyltransferases (alpha/beta hydrolase superfamily)